MNMDQMGEKTVRARLVTFVERNQNAKLLVIVMAGLAIGAIYFLTLKNREANDLIASQKIYLQDSTGGLKSVVELSKTGPEIGLMDAEGNRRVSFQVGGGKARVALQDKKGISRLVLAGGKGEPVLSVLGENEEDLVTLNLANIGPNFGFYGANAELNVRPFEQEGKTGLKLIDGHNNPCIVMETEGANSSLSFLDDTGQINTHIQIKPEGVSLLLMDTNNLVRAQFSLADEMHVVFFDSLGRKRAELMPTNPAELVFYDDTLVARESIVLNQQGAGFKLLDFENPAQNVTAENEEVK